MFLVIYLSFITHVLILILILIFTTYRICHVQNLISAFVVIIEKWLEKGFPQKGRKILLYNRIFCELFALIEISLLLLHKVIITKRSLLVIR